MNPWSVRRIIRATDPDIVERVWIRPMNPLEYASKSSSHQSRVRLWRRDVPAERAMLSREAHAMVTTFDHAAYAAYFAAVVLLWYIARQFQTNRTQKRAA